MYWVHLYELPVAKSMDTPFTYHELLVEVVLSAYTQRLPDAPDGKVNTALGVELLKG